MAAKIQFKVREKKTEKKTWEELPIAYTTKKTYGVKLAKSASLLIAVGLLGHYPELTSIQWNLEGSEDYEYLPLKIIKNMATPLQEATDD